MVFGGVYLAAGALAWAVVSGVVFSGAHKGRTGWEYAKLFAVGFVLAGIVTFPAVLLSWGIHNELMGAWMGILLIALSGWGAYELAIGAHNRYNRSVLRARDRALNKYSAHEEFIASEREQLLLFIRSLQEDPVKRNLFPRGENVPRPVFDSAMDSKLPYLLQDGLILFNQKFFKNYGTAEIRKVFWDAYGEWYEAVLARHFDSVPAGSPYRDESRVSGRVETMVRFFSDPRFSLSGKKVLDVGCGYGGSALAANG
jgi:hypothetical protein